MSWILPFGILIPLALLIVTIYLTIDCVKRRRDLFWFFILWALFGIGAIIYIIYYWDQVTAPLKSSKSQKIGRCQRCSRPGVHLAPFEDGRSVQHLCDMCRAEIELMRKLKNTSI
jgi:hypothetical protein